MNTDPIGDLVERAERYAQETGLALSTVSKMILNDGKRLEALKRGAVSCTVRRLQNATSNLAALETARRPRSETALADTG